MKSYLKEQPTRTTKGESIAYIKRSKNPLADPHRHRWGKNRNMIGRNGFGKPLGNMAAPYGAYSMIRNAFGTGSPTVTDRI